MQVLNIKSQVFGYIGGTRWTVRDRRDLRELIEDWQESIFTLCNYHGQPKVPPALIVDAAFAVRADTPQEKIDKLIDKILGTDE